MAGLTVNAGQSVIDVANVGNSTTLNIGGITHNVGGYVDFRASSGTFGSDSVVLTSQANDGSGILGAWATVNGGAAFAKNDGSGKIVALDNSGYTDINALGPNTIDNGPNTNVRINAVGTSGPVAISSAVTTINTLTQNTTTASIIDTSPGILRVGGATGSGAIVITPGNADLTIGTAPDSGILTAGVSDGSNGEIMLGNFSGSTLTVNSTITNNVGGQVSVTKMGSGLVVMAGTNTYTGATTIGDGTLALTGAGIISASSPVNLTGATAILDVTGISAGSITLGSLAGVDGSSVALGGKNLNVGGLNTSTVFAGVISGNGSSLTKTGSGALTLSGANTYTGGTNLTSGTLIANNNSALGTGTLTISPGVIFGSNVAGTTLANPVSVQGDFVLGSSPDTSTPANQNFTLSGAVNLNGATRSIVDNTSGGQVHFSGVISNGGLTLQVDQQRQRGPIRHVPFRRRECQYLRRPDDGGNGCVPRSQPQRG